MGSPRVWTIGHSRHQIPTFVALLRTSSIALVAEVRSHPFSRCNPQFNQVRLRAALARAGIAYLDLGSALGGRPSDPCLYDDRGKVDYALVAQSPAFAEGLDMLIEASEQRRVAVLCSEEDPRRCHRRLLVGRALTERGIPVSHIRGDGTVIEECSLPTTIPQLALFDAKDPWS